MKVYDDEDHTGVTVVTHDLKTPNDALITEIPSLIPRDSYTVSHTKREEDELYDPPSSPATPDLSDAEVEEDSSPTNPFEPDVPTIRFTRAIDPLDMPYVHPADMPVSRFPVPPPTATTRPPSQELMQSPGLMPPTADANRPTRPKRIVRFKSRVRISSGIHHQKPSLSRSSSFSDSSSISAPLRWNPSPSASPSPLALDDTFSAEDFDAWLSQKSIGSRRNGNQSDASGEEGEEGDGADEQSALIIHRKRRGPNGTYRPRPPQYTKMNGGIPHLPSPLSPKRGRYGAINPIPHVSPGGRKRRSRSRSTEKAEWGWSYLSPSYWWSQMRPIFCCFPTSEDDLTPQI